MRRGWFFACAVACGCSSSDAEPLPRLEIIIDDRGVPHVFGATDDDAFFGAGYQMASDRLFQMEMMRRRSQGTAAAVLGERAVDDDELARIFDWPGWARQHEAAMMAENPDTYAVLDAWSQGVNARIAEVSDDRPWGFRADQFDFVPEPWTPFDILTIATMTGFGNDLSFDREIFATIAYKLAADALASVEILKPIRPVYTMGPLAGAAIASQRPRTPAPFTTAIDPDQLARTIHGLRRVQRLRGLGSNNWAVAGEHTANGSPMLAGDPHQNFDPPGIFYAQHINSKDQGGTIDAAGFSFVGTPGISVGQTDRIMWTPTTAFADVMDVWTVAVPDADHVRIGGQSIAVVHRQEVITVRGEGKPLGEGTTRALDLIDVPGYGVLLPTDLVPLPLGDPGDRLLMNWTGFRPSTFAGLLDFNKAQDIDEFDAAVDNWSGNFNFLAADSGGITYRVGTKVPVRDATLRPDLVMDGDDAATLWTDARLPKEQLPHGRGEGRGFLVTANNDPFGFAADGRIDDDPWYFGAYFDPGWRAGRIESELYRMTAQGGMTIADMQALQDDVHSSLADDLLPMLAEAYGRIDSDPALAEFASRPSGPGMASRPELDTLANALAGWDRDMRRDSGPSLVMHAYGYFVTRRTLADDLPLLFLQALELQPSFIVKIATMSLRGDYPDGAAVLQEGRDYILLAALSDTADLLMQRYGAVDPGAYRLSDMRFSDLDGATGTGIDRGLHATDGCMSSPNVVADSTFFDAQGGVVAQSTSPHGPIFRITGEFDGDTPVLHFAFPLGNVADPDSPHFEDIHADWLEGRSRTMLFAKDEIEAAEERRYRLREDDP